MEMFSYLMATGISTGALYSLVALGIVVIYKATNIVNFAHGESFMMGGFLAYTFHIMLGLPTWHLCFFPLSVHLLWVS